MRLMFLVAVVALGSGTAQARNPWQLRCASMPAEQLLPGPLEGAARAFVPWAGSGARRALHAGPIYVLALSNHTAISRDGDPTDSAGEYLHRALVAIAPSQHGAVSLSGHRLGAAGPRTQLVFSTNGANSCTVHGVDVDCIPRSHRFAPMLRIAASPGWRIVRTELRIGRTGCFELTVSGSGLHEQIPLAVPGPDWSPSTGWGS